MFTQWPTLVVSLLLVSALHLSFALYFTCRLRVGSNTNDNIRNFSVLFVIISGYSILGLVRSDLVRLDWYLIGYNGLLILSIAYCSITLKATKVFPTILLVLFIFFLISFYLYQPNFYLKGTLLEAFTLASKATLLIACASYLIKSNMARWVNSVVICLVAYYLMTGFLIALPSEGNSQITNPYFYLFAAVVAVVQVLSLIKLHLDNFSQSTLLQLAPELTKVGILVLDSGNKVVYSNRYFRDEFDPARQIALLNQLTSEATIINRKMTQASQWSSIVKTGSHDKEAYTYVACSASSDQHLGELRVFTLMDFTEQTNYKKALEESGEKLNELSSKILSNHEIERAKISRELHSDIGQQLTLLKFTAALLEREDIRAQLELGVEDILQSVRVMSRQLRPAVMDELGLQQALDGFVKSAAFKEIDINYQFDNNGFDLQHPVDINLYRLIYEYITTLVTKEHATEVDLQIVGDKDLLTLIIEDNAEQANFGDAIKDSSEYYAEGVLTLKERVRVLGGNITISSIPNSGNVLKVELEGNV